MLTSLSFITDGKPPELELEILEEDARKYNLTPSRAISLPYKPRAPSSTNFTGRRDYLEKLRAYFSVEHDKPLRRKSFLLCGMGGIGKTQICLKFAEENSDM
jgi:DNA replication protein DnaC